MVRRLRPVVRFLVLALIVAVFGCFPGARAPNVAPQRILGLTAAESGGKTSRAAFGVVFAGPKGETSDPSEVSIVFNRPMRALELASDEGETAPPVTLATTGGATPAGTWRWLGTSALMFAPEKALPRATEYVVHVPGATKALDGSVLGSDFSFSFTTPRPEVVHFSPASGATHLEPTQAFELRFNQPVDPKEVERATTITAFQGKKPIPFVASRPKADVPMLVKLTPKMPLPLAAPIVVAVDATVRGLEGPLPSGAPREVNVETYGPLSVSEVSCWRTEAKLCAPHGGVHVELSNRVSFAEFKTHLRIEPPLPIHWAKGRDDGDKVAWMEVPVDPGADRSFRIVVTPGLKDEYGQVLAREHSVTLRTDDERPDLRIGLAGTVFEDAKAKGRTIPISSVNVDRFELVSGRTDELGLMKMLKWFERRDETYAFVRSIPGANVEDIRPATAKNVVAHRKVSTDALLGPKGKGLAFVATSRTIPGNRSSVELLHASVTDLAISAKLSRFGSLVLVTKLSDGKPVSGATVAVREADGREIVHVTTDARGIAMLSPDRFQPIKADGSIDETLVLFARSGDDWTYREARDTVSRAEMPDLDMAARMPVFGMLFTDRGIYKTGDVIRVKGVFRQNRPLGMETPRGREMTIRASDPEGGTMFEHKAKLGAFGEVSVDIPIAATSRLGRVQIDAIAEGEAKKESWEPNAASTSIEVAAYRPAEFKVSIDPGRPTFIRGDKATFTVRGDYLFGAPMSGGKVRASATRNRTSFTPPATEGFEVGDDAYHWALADVSPRGGKFQDANGALNDKGTFESPVGLSLPKQEAAETVTFEAEIEDLSRQTISSQTTVLVHPAEFYVAIERPKDMFMAANAALRPGVAAVEPSGKRRSDVRVKVDLISRTWITATEATGDEAFHYESRAVDTVVGSCETRTSSTVASCDLRPTEAGFYVVRATSADKRGNPIASSYNLYVSGDGARVAWPVYDGPKLEIVTDKTSYEIGDVANVLVKSPWSDAEALLTVERQGIHQQERTTVHGSMPTFRVPITASMWPNVFVGIELLKGRTAAPAADVKKGSVTDVGAPSYRIGWVEIDVNPEARRLNVGVKPSKKDVHPGDEVDVDLLVTDRAGKGAKADVAFYAVDEGVLMLTGYKTPDPLPVFSARRSLSVMPIESRDDLARIVRLARGPGEDKGDEGGGGGGIPTRQDFRTTAFFQPSVLTDGDGKARVHFKLPDSLTTYRLMAVATSDSDRFGFGQESIVTSRPLMARPALPRFLRAGDAIDAGVILTSKSLPAQTVEVKLDAKGLLVQGDATRRVNVPANGSVEVRWSIGAPHAGKASLAFHARSPSARDDVTIEREIEVPASPEAVALYGDTETAVAEQLGDLVGMRTDTGGLDLRIASTALVGLDGGVDALMQYPYGCTEQLTSRMVPLVALADLTRDYGVKLPGDPSAIVDEALVKILKAQRADGSFGYWPDSVRGDTWLTAYALWGLSLAGQRGRPVPETATENATRWLRDQLAACGSGESEARTPKKMRASAWECGDDDVMLSSQAFVLDVLAMTGHADAGYAARLFARREKMPLFARALLAHAMTLTKMRAEDAKELVRDVEGHVRVTPTGATIAADVGDRYAPLLDSDNRTTAIVLRALVTIDPKHPLASRLAKGLLAARRGGAWRSTQENAWALLALDDYRKAQEREEPQFDASVFFGEREVLTTAFHGRSVRSESTSFAADKIFGRAGQSLAFQVHGKGRLFYEARLRYSRSTLPTTSLDRGLFVRKLVRAVKPESLRDAMRILPQISSGVVNASDLVLVDLIVVTPDPREQVVIDDPLPAGLEPVQAKLATTARDLSVTEPGDEGDEGDERAASDIDERAGGRAFEESWYHREFHDDRVLTFVDRMAAGMYHYRYLARATTPGRFVVPPTRAECMYEPETFGRTGAVTFEVKADRPAEPKK